MRAIYDYKDIRKLEQSLLSEELRSGIIVTATSSLAIALRAYYPEYTVIGMHELISELLPEWDENTKDLRNYLSLRNSLDNYAVENGNDDSLLLSLQRNATDIWNAILLLIEADVYPNDIPDDISAPVKHFKEVWRELEIENSTLMNLRAQFAYRLSDERNVVPCIESCIKRAYKNKEINVKERRLFFIGFYFITPIQARIIDILSLADLDIAYLNCRDMRYRHACEIWEKTFAEEYKGQSAVDIQPDVSLYNSFGEYLASGKKPLEVDITKYSSNLEFAEAMRAPIKTGASFFTPDLKRCEEILKEYYPECFKRKHLLAFPVGQYLYYLHMMWNSFHGCLELKYDYVYKCFATGWLEDGNTNGREYLFELSKLEPYLKDCKRIEDWNDTFQVLKRTKKSIKKGKLKSGPNMRWHELLGNPFVQLGAYNLSYDKIEAMDRLIKKLIEDALFLFSSTDKVMISEHFAKIAELVNGHMHREDVLDGEMLIAKELLRNLELAGMQDQECPLSAIKDAIILLIGSHFDEVDTLDQEISLTGDRIAPLSMVESSMLENYGEDIYLVLADEFALPGTRRDLPWPLSDKLLDSLKIEDREDTMRYVRCMRSVIENRPLSYRYLFFSLVSNVNEENHPRLHFSWIANQDKKTLSASPYIIMMWPDVTEKEYEDSSIDFEEEIAISDVDISRIDIKAPTESVPELVKLDYKLCQYRYLYSYLVNYLPYYKSYFHYSFLLTSLTKVLSKSSGKDKDDTAEVLVDLFPLHRPIEFRQALDYYGNGTIDTEPTRYDGVDYKGGIMDIHFIEAKDLALKIKQGGTISIYDREKRCMYCPYSYVCIYRNGEKAE